MLETINKQINKHFVKQKLYAMRIGRSVNNLPNFKVSLLKRLERLNKDIACIGMSASMYRDDYYTVEFRGTKIDVDYDFDREEIRDLYIKGVEVTMLINEHLEEIQVTVERMINNNR